MAILNCDLQSSPQPKKHLDFTKVTLKSKILILEHPNGQIGFLSGSQTEDALESHFGEPLSLSGTNW